MIVAWSSVFTQEDFVQFQREVAACDSWGDFEAMLYEWEESYVVATSGVVEEAMREPAEPQPLAPPERGE